MTKPSEGLQRTREILLEQTWVDRPPSGPNETCLLLALADGCVAVGAPMREGWDVLEDIVGTPVLHKWNDEPGRTFTEVIQAVDDAILLAKEREAAE